MYSETMENLMISEGLTPETKLYRYTNAHHVIKNDSEETMVKANTEAQEMVVDHYTSGHITKAKEVGAGLAFCISRENEYKEEGKLCIEISLKTIIDQGGKAYKDKSSFEYDSWFLTMPEGDAVVKVL
jgi:hypothetical protein